MIFSLRDVVGWRKDWRACGDSGVLDKRRAVWKSLPRNSRQRMRRQLNRLRLGRESIIKEFAFDQMDALELDGSLESTPSPLRLLELADMRDTGNGPDPRRWYEAISMFDMTLVQAMIEESDSLDRIGEDIDAFITMLGSNVFTGPPTTTWVYSYHTRPVYMVGEQGISIGRPLRRHEGLTERRTRLDMRPLPSGQAYVRPRRKDPFWTMLKLYKQMEMLEKGTWEREVKGHEPDEVRDRAGVRLVVPSVKLVYDIVARIMFEVTSSGGDLIGSFENNMSGDPRAVDVSNPHSSPNFRAAKFDGRWQGRIFEIQFMTIWDYVTSRFATDTSGWNMYKLRQMMDAYFPLLFPTDLFGFNWETDMRLRGQLIQQMEDRLGWRRLDPSGF